LFGTGVETFAYAYYFVRPQAHNLTSEWDYLYNKAHNEYLNYFATTGFIGLGTYLLVISTVIIVFLYKIFNFQISYFNNFKTLKI
jgi:O-antigen ligase